MEEALWALGRATGVAALLLFTVSVVLGIVTRSGHPLPGLPRFSVALVHRNVSVLATVFLVLHVVSLLFDPYAQLKLLDAVVPFFADYRPFWQGLGTGAADLVLAIVLTGLLRRVVGPRVFRAVHWSTYAMWPIALAHSVGTGTNGTDAWFLMLALLCAAAVSCAGAWRLTVRFGEFSRARAAPDPRPPLVPATHTTPGTTATHTTSGASAAHHPERIPS